MWKPFYVLPIVLALLLGGCANGSKFSEIVLADVQQAKVLAEQADDQLAVKCWTHLEQLTLANIPNPDAPVGRVVGVMSAYQKARNVRRKVEAGISDQSRLECGPMLMESRSVSKRLGARAAF